MKRIVKAHILRDRMVQLSFDDGHEGTVDFSQYPENGVFLKWTDPGFFAKVRIAHHGRALEWPDEIDLCADSLWVESGGGTPDDALTRPSVHA